MKTPSVTWIVVAGAHKSYLFERTKKFEISLIDEIHADLDEQHEKPGRVFDSNAGGARHAIEPHTDRREVERQNFSRKIISYLERGSKKDKFKRFILFAEPKMLGILNRHLDGNLASKMSKSFPKNFAEMEVSEIEERVLELLNS
jgi:protein required for attachment to host cells